MSTAALVMGAIGFMFGFVMWQAGATFMDWEFWVGMVLILAANECGRRA